MEANLLMTSGTRFLPSQLPYSVDSSFIKLFDRVRFYLLNDLTSCCVFSSKCGAPQCVWITNSITEYKDNVHIIMLSKLRLVSINDVYELRNLPKLQTFLAKLTPVPSAVLLVGDFLSPSPLSSLDGGKGMVATLRAAGGQYFSFVLL